MLPLASVSRRMASYAWKRSLSSEVLRAVDAWIASPKELVLTDRLHKERVADLFITLPTRDGIRFQTPKEPKDSDPLGFGHHIAFFHHRVPESRLSPDKTDGEYKPPTPFDRRMWASGVISWDIDRPLRLGQPVAAYSQVSSIQKKGFDGENPMIFLNQTINYTAEGSEKPSVVEERMHVYLPRTTERSQTVRPVTGLPVSHDFSFTYTPSLTTLFRFSALMFNAHHIHLDKDYAQTVDGYSERLVHGPLTALMLLETVSIHYPDAQVERIEYRARNPMPVGRAHTIYGAWTETKCVTLWCADDAGVVGMTGKVNVA